MPEPFIQVIIEAVARYYNVDPLAIVGTDRHLSVARARHVAMYVSRLAGKCSYPQIGEAFGNKDHTTARSACQKMERRAAADPEFKEVVGELVKDVLGIGLAGGPVKIRHEILVLLQEQVAQGIYGKSVEDLVDRILCDYFQRELKQ